MSKRVLAAFFIMACALSVAGQSHKEAAQWCDPQHDILFEVNTTPYHCIPDAHGPKGKQGHWEEDVQSEQAAFDRERHQYDLAHALVTRVLTAKELAEVLEDGPYIYVHEMEPFFPKDIDEKFTTALAIQRELRAMSEQKPCSAGGQR